MKKIILVSTFIIGALLVYKPAEAQLRVHVNINANPAWAHADPYWQAPPQVVYVDDRRFPDRRRRDFDNRRRRYNHDQYDDRRRYNKRYDDRYDRGRHHHRRDNRGYGNGRGRW
jgi:hypothetical protein